VFDNRGYGTYKTFFNTIEDLRVIFSNPHIRILWSFAIIISCFLFILTYEMKNLGNRIMWLVVPKSTIQTPWDKGRIVLKPFYWYNIWTRGLKLIQSMFSNQVPFWKKLSYQTLEKENPKQRDKYSTVNTLIWTKKNLFGKRTKKIIFTQVGVKWDVTTSWNGKRSRQCCLRWQQMEYTFLAHH